MDHDPKAYLYDILKSCDAIIDYTKGVVYESYTGDRMIQDAVERNFITIGEALNRIRTEAPDLLDQITDSKKIIAFRNIVVHAYDSIEDSLTWDIVQSGIEKLKDECEKLINS